MNRRGTEGTDIALDFIADIQMMKGIDVPCMGKDSLGWGNMTGLASVFMAQRGFTGVEPLFSETPEKMIEDGFSF